MTQKDEVVGNRTVGSRQRAVGSKSATGCVQADKQTKKTTVFRQFSIPAFPYY